MAGDELVMLDFLRSAGVEVAPRAMDAARGILREYPHQALEMLREVKIAGAWRGGSRADGLAEVLGEDVGDLVSYSTPDDGQTWELFAYQTDPILEEYEQESHAMAALDGVLVQKGWSLSPQRCAGCKVAGFPSWLAREGYPVLTVIGPAPDAEWARFICADCAPMVHDLDEDLKAELEQRRKAAEQERRAREIAGTPAGAGQRSYRNASTETIPAGTLVTLAADGGVVRWTTGQNMVGVANRTMLPGEYGVIRTMLGVPPSGSDPTAEVMAQRQNLGLVLEAVGVPPATAQLLCAQLGSSRRYLSAVEAELLRRFFTQPLPYDPWTLPDWAVQLMEGITEDLEEAARDGNGQAEMILRGTTPIVDLRPVNGDARRDTIDRTTLEDLERLMGYTDERPARGSVPWYAAERIANEILCEQGVMAGPDGQVVGWGPGGIAVIVSLMNDATGEALVYLRHRAIFWRPFRDGQDVEAGWRRWLPDERRVTTEYGGLPQNQVDPELVRAALSDAAEEQGVANGTDNIGREWTVDDFTPWRSG